MLIKANFYKLGLRLKKGILVPPLFWNYSYWSRAFWSDRSRLLIGRHRTKQYVVVVVATAFPRWLPQMLQWDWGLAWEIFFGQQWKKYFFFKLKKPKLLEIAWFGEKIDRKSFLKFLTKILPLEFSLAVGSRGSHNRKRSATRLQRGVAPWSRSSAPARGRSVSDAFP